MIYINLIPSNLWYLNLRKMLSTKEWKNLSLKIRNEANWTCYCCNISINQLKNTKYFHAHEYWIFDRKSKTVKLAAIVCVCSHCHESIHLGLASVKNRSNRAVHHLMKVNKWTYQDANNYVEVLFEENMLNSTIDWQFDINSFKDWLNEDQLKQVIQFLEQNKKC